MRYHSDCSIIYMDGCMKEMTIKIHNVGAKLRLNGVQHFLVTGLFVDDTVLLAES